MTRKLTAWELVDELLTEMNDTNFRIWSKDRIAFRNILIDEMKQYLREEGNISIVDSDEYLEESNY